MRKGLGLRVLGFKGSRVLGLRALGFIGFRQDSCMSKAVKGSTDLSALRPNLL